MTNEEFRERITAAMLAEPAVAKVVAMDFPELVDNKRAMDILVNAVGRELFVSGGRGASLPVVAPPYDQTVPGDEIVRGVDDQGRGYQIADRRAHPAADLDAPRDADDTSPVTRGYLQIGQAEWVRIASIEWIGFNTGPGDDSSTLRLRNGELRHFEGQQARDFRARWTAYLAGDELRHFEGQQARDFRVAWTAYLAGDE